MANFTGDPNSVLCQYGERLAASVPMKALLVTKIVICIAGLALFALLGKVKPPTIIQHVNCRVLIRYNAIVTYGYTVVVLVYSMWDLIRLSIPRDNACLYLLDRRTAEIFHAVASSFLFMGVLSSSLISLERAWCTFNLSTYENAKAQNAVIGLLLVMTAAIFFIFYFLNLRSNANWNIPKLGFTTKGALNNYPTEYIIIVAFSIEFVTFVVLRIVYFFNKLRHYRIRNSPASIGNGPSLSSKYMIKENISVTITWGYLLTTHFAIMLLSYPAIIFVMHTSDNPVETVLLCEAFNWMPLHGIALLLIIMHRYPTLKWRAFEFFFRKRIDAARDKVAPVDCQWDTKLYFCHLHDLFNGKSEEPKLFSFCI
ncbi:hypothetical protein QR680_017979 [Steinernema hermaphroditum]|uniref:Uncharacterized protein n=1 Tax=Steinernema hermaphroditum TaxID=289476 RepID=A0AA39HIP6_9BILA|nr:hypothetical protein QR680_017979 [Steinernema hermaphroditum]